MQIYTNEKYYFCFFFQYILQFLKPPFCERFVIIQVVWIIKNHYNSIVNQNICGLDTKWKGFKYMSVPYFHTGVYASVYRWIQNSVRNVSYSLTYLSSFDFLAVTQSKCNQIIRIHILTSPIITSYRWKVTYSLYVKICYMFYVFHCTVLKIG